MLLIEETEEEVDLRPRKPPLGRRKEECGVNGAGDKDDRFGVVLIRDGGIKPCGIPFACFEEATSFAVTGRGLGSFGPIFELASDLGLRSVVEKLAFLPGDLALFAESTIQCLK